MSLIADAAMMASSELPTLSFSSMFWRWRLTVWMLMHSLSAMILLGYPSRMRLNISFSRGVSIWSLFFDSATSATSPEAMSIMTGLMPTPCD